MATRVSSEAGSQKKKDSVKGIFFQPPASLQKKCIFAGGKKIFHLGFILSVPIKLSVSKNVSFFLYLPTFHPLLFSCPN